MDKFLQEMLEHIDNQCSAINLECSVLRKLLKPWPKKRKTVPEVCPQEKKEKDVKTENTGLNSVEELALQQMNHLINKAQKTIKLKEKHRESTKPDDTESIDVNNAEETKDISLTNDSQISQSNMIATSNTKEDTKLRQNISHRKGNQVSSVKQSRSSSVSNNPPHLSTKGVKSTSSLSSRRPAPSSSITARSSSASSLSRPSSTKSRYTPAHANAPFKTDVNTKVPHRNLHHIHKNQINKPSGVKQKSSVVTKMFHKQSSFTNKLKTLPNIGTEAENLLNECDIGEDKNQNDNNTLTTMDDHVCVVTNNGDDDEMQQSVTTNNEFLDENHLVDDLQFACDSSNLDVQQEVRLQSAQLPDHSQKQEAFFSLKDKRSEIKVPSRLSKLVSENHTLSDKCSKIQLMKKTQNVDLAANFIKSLEEFNNTGPELFARAKALSCLQSHQLMMSSLQSLGIEKISASTPFETVHRAKRVLEFLLSKFAQSQDEADYFTKVQFRPIKSCDPTDVALSRRNDQSVLSMFTKEEKQSSTHKSDVFEGFMSSKLRTKLKFEKHLHTLCLHLMSLCESEWWNTLIEDPTNESVVQMVHSVMTSSGEFFPAIVKTPDS